MARSPSTRLQFDSGREAMSSDQPASPHSSSPQFGSPTFASQPSPTSSSNRHSECSIADSLPTSSGSPGLDAAGPKKGVSSNNISPSSRLSYNGEGLTSPSMCFAVLHFVVIVVSSFLPEMHVANHDGLGPKCAVQTAGHATVCRSTRALTGYSKNA